MRGKKARRERNQTPGLIDYSVYELKPQERILGYVMGLVAGFAIMQIFFYTWIVSVIVGVAAGFAGVRFYRNHLLEKRNRELTMQFKDLLESLTNSFSAGKNTYDAFTDAYNDLGHMYREEDYIIRELDTILSGLANGHNIEDLLMDFANRSGLEDIASFANVFEVTLRQGANIKNIILSTRDIICDKIEAEMDIQTILAGNKNELNIMLVMPFVICLMLNMSGSESADNSLLNIVVKIGVLCVFVAAYQIGKKVTDIRL